MSGQDGKGNTEYILTRHLDGELDRREEARLREKLAADGDLQEELRRYTALDEQIRALGESELEDIDYEAQRKDIVTAVERSILLRARPRRRWIARPAFRVLAAAAMVLIVVSVGVLMFLRAGPKLPPGSEQVVTVAMLPVAPPIAGGGELSVELKRLDMDQLAMVPSEPARTSSLPSGTVLVSVGPKRKIAASLFPAEMFGIE